MKKLCSNLLPVLASALPIMMAACASLSLNNVDFAWPVESSLLVSSSNMVEDGRYAVAFNVTPLAVEEFQDSSALKGKSLRVLRNTAGFYFVTSGGFKSVYVFSPGEGALCLNKKISIGKNAEGEELKLNDPALNQRPPNVELIDGKLKILLSPDGIVEQPSEGPKGMKTTLIAALVVLFSFSVFGQESDLEVKNSFEKSYRSIVAAIDSAQSTATLDSLLNAISALESKYASRKAFLDKALYPETFTGNMAELRSLQSLTYDRVLLIQSQGMTIAEYETRLASLEVRLDSLTADRDRLFSELRASRKSLTEMREKMKILSRSLEARDRLTFALLDSIFLPYDKNLSEASEVQKEAVTRKLLKSNVVARVYDIAADNVKFLDETQLQAKDYAVLIEQQQQFEVKWMGLRDKINAVAVTVEPSTTTKAASASGKKGKETAGKNSGTPEPPSTPTLEPASHVDAIVSEWEAKLHASFWAGLNKEFSTKGIYVRPFTDGPGFSASIRSYVDSAKVDGRDVFVFVNDIWKDRIDKEWREPLTKDSMLGKEEYASLDKAVSELGEKKFDLKFMIYVFVAAAAAFGGWWLVQKKPKKLTT